ncbi:MAG: hypothetical protein ACOX6P_00585 [Candidatus Merdivicinus sp.]
MRKQWLLPWIGMFLCIIGLSGCSENKQIQQTKEPFVLYFFHDTACENCDGISEFYELFNEKLEGIEIEKVNYQLYTYNVFQTEGNNVWKSLTEDWGLDATDISFPALLANGRAFSGMEQIGQNIREQFLVGMKGEYLNSEQIQKENQQSETDLFSDWKVDPDHLTVAYFYRYTCPECEETRPFIESLPENVEVNGVKFPLDLVKINTRSGRGGDRVRKMFEAYQVPEEDQVVPIVFLRDTYLAGYDAISTELEARLAQGEGLNFEWPRGESE